MDSILFVHLSISGLWAVSIFGHTVAFGRIVTICVVCPAQKDAEKVPYPIVQCLAAVGSA